MNIEEVIHRIEEIGIVPVVRAATVEEANRAVEAICAGGIPVVEITMTVPNAISVIREVSKQRGGVVLIGAGTVTNAEQAESCLRAGAQFLVSPGLALSVLNVLAEGTREIGNPGRAYTDGVNECSRARSAPGEDLPLRKCGWGEISEVAQSPVPARVADSDRRRECSQRRRVHRRRSVRPWRRC